MMKSFYDMPILDEDPAAGLLIEDELPDVVDMSGYRGLRGLAQVLSRATPAEDLRQIAKAVETLGVRGMRILRVDRHVPSTIMDQDGFDCLGGTGLTLCSICGDPSESPQDIVKRLAFLLAWNVGDVFGNWATLSAYKVAAKKCDLKGALPDALCPPDFGDAADFWGLPVPANSAQASKFAGLVADSCMEWNSVHGILASTSLWLFRDETGRDSFNELIDAFRDEDPLAALRKNR